MNQPATPLAPTEISLHRKSRLLEIAFSDGFRFKYPCEYLRVFAASSEGQGKGQPVHGKEKVEIVHLEPRGDTALQLAFDDGCTADYAWTRLHELGVNYARHWHAYVQELDAGGLKRVQGRAAGADGKVTIELLYFIDLAKIAGRDTEQVSIPATVTDVQTLLAWLRKRGDAWAEAFADDRVQLTVNKHFAEPFTLIEQGDEVALVPRQK